MSVKFDVTKRIEWLKKRITITEQDEEYIRLQIMEAMMEALEKGYKEGYEDGANAAANDIAANPHKMY